MRVTLIAAQSVDGFITRHQTPGTRFTSAADQAHFARVLRDFDCSVMGATTYQTVRDTIRRRLEPARRRVVLTHHPERYAAEAIPGALEFTRDEPDALLQRLAASGHRECALLGGAQIHRLFLERQRVNRLWLTIEPRLFGTGTPLVGGEIDRRLRLESVERLPESDSLLVKYQVEVETSGTG